ncbi:uncharacterized protein AKAW2_61091S [Aspergillus luchuensis]|uniref:Proline dehydrogenase n=1 Tax=Aspergillus kawachii TaxID=1069201 RepID=A0A146EXV8_ASPKA|nr:uncharacterized protein AKAW2_61091S [Aspergillus luchuensis]BCS02827.1 hypothetical protein AKAW2_61091S [Aspergillus luchuensis]BCS14480.1 hypothetical protein ALUC_61036S [Aspergillus luchuensis]GAA87620.1 proline oxidase Put1 [Aspergillus luchuensis IFO 4308]GAT18830.1 proline oxidase Put1 [Aspergillus luchuensis]
MVVPRTLRLLRGARNTSPPLQVRCDFDKVGRAKSTASVGSIGDESKTLNAPSQHAQELPPHSLLPNKMLLRSLLVATISSRPWLLTPALKMLQSLVHPRLSFVDVDKNPLLRSILKRTFYNHFCAGENRDEVQSTISNIKDMGFKGVILTYAREIVVDATGPASKSGASVSDQSFKEESAKDQGIEDWKEGVLETVNMIGEGDILALKLTGAGESAMKALAANTPLPDQLMDALQQICTRAVDRNARIFIDAEQQSVQTGIDTVALDLMRKYNTNGTAVVFNTYQAYLKSTPNTVKAHLDIAEKEKFTLGIKLVRGAYINSEPRDLINDTKPETDNSYNFIAASIIRQRYGTIGGNSPFPSTELFLATHNRESALMADRLVKEQLAGGLQPPKIQYGQLLGMADGVSCKLLQIGNESTDKSRSVAPEVFKCLSWGSLGDCLSYLLRRAVENRDAVGRTKEEYLGLRRETFRRLRRGFM